MKQRLDHIDRAKGILIILTVIGHIWQAGYVHNAIYAFHMPAFFAISGMLLHYTRSYEKPWKQFLFSRIYAFGIPFVFIEALGCLTDILRHGITLNIKGYAFNTLTLHFNDPNLWFLFALFWIEILFSLLKKCIRDDRLILAAAVVLFFASIVLPRGNSYVSSLAQVCRNFLFFAMGFYGSKYLEKPRRWLILLSAAVVLGVAALFGKRSAPGLTIPNIGFLISSVLGTYMVLQWGKIPLPGKLDRFLIAAGKNTITIYGTHHILYSIVGVLLGITDYASTPLGAGLLMLVVVVLLEIPVVFIINRWLPFLAGKYYQKKEHKS